MQLKTKPQLGMGLEKNANPPVLPTQLKNDDQSFETLTKNQSSKMNHCAFNPD